MKYFLTSLTFLLATTTICAQYGYNIRFQQAHSAPKELMSSLLPVLGQTYDVAVSQEELNVTTTVDFGVLYVDSLLHTQGVTDAVVTAFKGRKYAQPKAGNQNCSTAQLLCTNDVVAANSNSIGYQELHSGNRGCLLTNERQASWYYLNVQTGGSLVLRIRPDNNNDDYDFAVWGPFTASTAQANCPPASGPIRCSYSAQTGSTGIGNGATGFSENANGNKWVAPVNVSAGQVYILYIDNYSASGTGYTLSFDWGNTNGNNQSTAILGCDPIVLPVGVSAFSGTYSAAQNAVSWTTISELNNDYFTLEWSASGTEDDWQEVAQVKGAGNSNLPIDYTTFHAAFKRNALNYYRLVQTDFDGKRTTLDRIAVVDNRTEDNPVVKTVNLLGQEVAADEPGLVIFFYEDGTQQKRVNPAR